MFNKESEFLIKLENIFDKSLADLSSFKCITTSIMKRTKIKELLIAFYRGSNQNYTLALDLPDASVIRGLVSSNQHCQYEHHTSY